EDGIRDYKVTGVQTCALPIYRRPDHLRAGRRRRAAGEELHQALPGRIRAPHRAWKLPGAQGCRAQMGPGGCSPRAPPREPHGRGGLMPKIEVDGKPVEVPQGATVMDATHKLGV